jgi:type IX secretion system PorP/SprF family membrane protein
MKRILIYLFAVIAVKPVIAQQLPHFSQYMLNDYAENCAIAGKNPYIEAASINRYQWFGITDAPRTYMLSVDGGLKNPHFGVGGQVFTDIVGPTRRTGCYLSYAYHANITKDIKLSLGVQGGLLQYMVDGSKILLHDQTDYVMSNGLQSVLMPEFGFGIYAYSKDKWYAGFSVPEIVENKLKFFDYMANTPSVITRHYTFMAGYKYDLNELFAIQPSCIVWYGPPAPVQFDLGVRLTYRGKIWVGASYRNLDAIVGLIGYTYRENITIGYAYDYATTNIQNYSTGSHELFVALRFNRGSAPAAAKTP